MRRRDSDWQSSRDQKGVLTRLGERARDTTLMLAWSLRPSARVRFEWAVVRAQWADFLARPLGRLLFAACCLQLAWLLVVF